MFHDRNGKPLIVLGLQTMNSSLGTNHIRQAIEAVKLCEGNTIEVPVYWNWIEKEYGQYDMSPVEKLISEVREAGLYLIILWFGASKNGHPNYAPDYVKIHPETYRLAVGPDGMECYSLSPFCEATLQRDLQAFSQLMCCVRDFGRETVIAVQIENEMGFANTDMDYSAQDYYRMEVPREIRDIEISGSGAPRNHPSWPGLYGRYAHEAFSAYYTAQYIQSLAAAGKAILDLPLYTNVMVGEQGIEEAGINYNAGAAVGRVLEIWKRTAPSLDFISPDIYNQETSAFDRICRIYKDPLFIPECPISGTAVAINIIRAFGMHRCTGLCCFGAERALDENGINEQSRSMSFSMKAVSRMAPLLLECLEGKGLIQCATQEEFARETYLKFPGYHVLVHYFQGGKMQASHMNLEDPHYAFHKQERGRVLICQREKDTFYLAGAGVLVDFIAESDGENRYLQLTSRTRKQLNHLSVEEGHFDINGQWICDFSRNGDQSNFEVYLHGGEMVRVRLNPAR